MATRDAACSCGQLRLTAEGDPIRISMCHCLACQRRTGSAAAVSARIAPGSLRITSGQELVRAYDPGDGGFLKVFCSGCGGALWAQHPSDPEVRVVRLGVFDRDPGIRPSYRQFVAYAAPWEPIPDDGLPRHAERLPA